MSTKNQHFVSQVEQRLNAINPEARPKKQRIYEFRIADREQYIVRLTHERGRPIVSNLSMFDLFSFDVGDDGVRANFEKAFGDYEARIGGLTACLLKAHDERSKTITQELFDLFVAKMVNFVRNPYSVEKVLNTFGAMAQLHPTDPSLYAAYERILLGRRPHQVRLCATLGITDEQYSAWLRVLFMALTPLTDDWGAMLGHALRTLFLERDKGLYVHIHKFRAERCLLSDRGLTWSAPPGQHLVLDFNLSARAFIRYAFLDYEALLGRPLPPGVSHGLSRGPKQVQVSYLHDDLPALNAFHRHVIEQSYESVFCSGLSPYGVTVSEYPRPLSTTERHRSQLGKRPAHPR
jgi:hypothetical protein